MTNSVTAADLTVGWVKKAASAGSDESIAALKEAYVHSLILIPSYRGDSVSVPGEILWSLYEMKTEKAAKTLRDIVEESLPAFTNRYCDDRLFELAVIALAQLNKMADSNSVALAQKIVADNSLDKTLREFAYYNCLCDEIKQKKFSSMNDVFPWLCDKYVKEVMEKRADPKATANERQFSDIVAFGLREYFRRVNLSQKPLLERLLKEVKAKHGEESDLTWWLNQQIEELGSDRVPREEVRYWLPEFATNYPKIQ
ncbi:MAG: hypothetical protein C0404_06450 [Verrucomicrobia bacterium]|nr:hypothetical protein [Verrucomicrobiota bacterium]